MSKNPPKAPSYRLHKASGLAVVTFGRQDRYLGPYGSEESRREYDRLVAEWLANGRRNPLEPTLTVDGLIVRYLAHVDARYRSQEPETIRTALAPVQLLYGDTPAAGFGPLALEACRSRYLANGYVRARVNKLTRHVVRMYRWGVARQVVPPSTWEGLRAVESIPKGTAGVKEGRKVRPARDEWIDAVLPHCSARIAAMIQVQRLTGARPDEMCRMRIEDVDRTGPVWAYTPDGHKTDHLDHDRVIFLGPAAQAALDPFLRGRDAGYVFRPDQRYPTALERYTPNSYRKSVDRAIARANRVRVKADPELPKIPHWHPHQVRHTTATAIRRELGVEVARTVLGHASLGATEIYAEADMEKARSAMERLG